MSLCRHGIELTEQPCHKCRDIARYAALTRDARRYRWLREGHKGCYNKVMIHAGTRLDAAVDEAMKFPKGVAR